MTNQYGSCVYRIPLPRYFSFWRNVKLILMASLPLFLLVSSGFSQGVTLGENQTNSNRSEDKGTEQLIPLEPKTDTLTLESTALKELEQTLRLREDGHIPQYYESIAMTTKRYISEKHQIKIVDTGQILESLPHDLTDSVADHVGEILRTCDMIQFSRHRPSRSELNRIYHTAKEFFESQIAASPTKGGTRDD